MKKAIWERQYEAAQRTSSAQGADHSKLETYSLNVLHDKGKHKARLFKAKLGITLTDKHTLANSILEAAVTNSATLKNEDIHGKHFAVDFDLTTEIGASRVRSLWIVRVNESYPRLVSVYPI